ncbi:MAG: hypothetical protein R3B72_26690 [Polyangiaceae bacterium]
MIWLRTFGDASYDGIFGLAPDGEDGVYLSGWFAGAIDLGGGPMLSAGDRDFFLARLDEDGELVWNKRYGGPYWDDNGPAIALHPGGLALCGAINSQVDFGAGVHVPNGYDQFVVLLGKDGSLVWETWIGGPGEQRCWGELAVDETTGDVLVGSRFSSQAVVSGQIVTSVGESDAIVTRLRGSDGGVLDQRVLSGTGDDLLESISVLEDGDVLISGVTTAGLDLGSGLVVSDEADAFVARLSADLATVKWGQVFVGPGNQRPFQHVVLRDGDILVTGALDGSVDFGIGPVVDSNGGFATRLSPVDGVATESRSLLGFDNPLWLVEATDGNLLIAGSYSGPMYLGGVSVSDPSTVEPTTDPVAVALSSDLATLEWKQLASHSLGWETFSGIASTKDDAVFIVGNFYETLNVDGCDSHPSAGDQDAFLMKRAQ